MKRKYSAGDVVLLKQKKEVKKGRHFVNLNGIIYNVSSDFDGLLVVICYDAEKGVYVTRELHGEHRRTFTIPPQVLDVKSDYAIQRNRFNDGDIVTFTPSGNRDIGGYVEQKVGDTWISALIGNVVKIVRVAENEELYLVQDERGNQATIYWGDLESCAEILQQEKPFEPQATQTAQADNSPRKEINGGITEIVLTKGSQLCKATAVPDNEIRIYNTKKSPRVVVSRTVHELVKKGNKYNFKVFKNDFTNELFFVFCDKGGVDINGSAFNKNKCITNKQLINLLVERFSIEDTVAQIKITGNLSNDCNYLTFKLIGVSNKNE